MTQSLEEIAKQFESSCNNYHNNLQYREYKEKLNTMYSKNVNRVRIRTKRNWHEREGIY